MVAGWYLMLVLAVPGVSNLSVNCNQISQAMCIQQFLVPTQQSLIFRQLHF